MLHVLNPLTLVLITIFQKLGAISFFESVPHFSFVVSAIILFKELDEVLLAVFVVFQISEKLVFFV